MKENFIQNTPLFAELATDEQRALGKRLRLENYSPNETIFVKDGDSESLYLIKEGWVKLTSNEGGPAVANLGPGSLLGETDFFLGQPRTTTARASGTVTVWSLTNEDLRDIIAERPDIGIHLGLAFGAGIAQYLPFLNEQLADTPLLQDLSERERAIIAHRLSPQTYEAHEALYRSGDAPTGLYLIEKGTVRLLGDTDDDYAELLPGEVFGEMAVISGKPHAKTAQAASGVIVWQLSPTDFADLAQNYPSIKTSLSQNLRSSLSGSDQEYALTVLRQISLFEDLPQEALVDIVRLLLLRHVPAGELIFSQGDSGDALYIVDAGAIEAVADSPGRPNELVNRFEDGDYFGEIALLTGKTRSYTAYAAADANLWVLYRTDFDNLLVQYPQLSAAVGRAVRERLSSSLHTQEPHLQRMAELGGLSQPQLKELAGLLQPRRYQAGSVVYYEGRVGLELYFIESGQVERWANGMQGPVLIESHAPGDFFGEIALSSGQGHLTTAHVLVDSEIWVLSKADFDEFLRRHPNFSMTFNRLINERQMAVMNRLRGMPQRAIPPATGPAPSPYGPPPGPGQSGPPVGMPPVPVRPVGPGPNPQAVQPAPPQPSSFHGQHTHGMPRLKRVGSFSDNVMPVPPGEDASVYSRHTQAFSPVRPPETASSKETPSPKRKNDHRPRRKSGVQGVVPPPPPSDSPEPKPPAPGRRPKSKAVKPARTERKKKGRRSRSVPPVRKPGPPPAEKATGKATAAPPASKSNSNSKALAPAKPDRRRRSRTASKAVQPSQALQPVVTTSNRRLQRHNGSVSVWFAKRSMSAKVGISVFLILLIWLCGIAAPSFIINSLAATFEDGGALPGDDRSILNQVREDGPSGAVAALPFVETATPTPSSTPTTTPTPSPSATPTETPIPTLTHTPTSSPTPTNTPTLVFTPTPTDTPTRAAPRATLPPTDTPTPEPTPTPDVDFRLKGVRQLTPCENRGKHHIFVKVQDPSGQGINGVPVKIQWAPVEDGFIVAKTESKTNLGGQIEPGRLDFAMFKGTYQVEVQGGTSEVATGITPDYGVNEPCGEDATANSLFHISFEVIFERTF